MSIRIERSSIVPSRELHSGPNSNPQDRELLDPLIDSQQAERGIARARAMRLKKAGLTLSEIDRTFG